MRPDELPPPDRKIGRIDVELDDGVIRGRIGPYPHRKIEVYECDPWDPLKRRLRKDLRVIALGWCAMAAVGIALVIFWPSATTTTMAGLIGISAAVVTWQVYRVIKRA
jgi:hypothetical protein